MRFVRWLVAVAVIGALHASMASAATKSMCNVPIRMSDGTVLRANVFLPASSGRFPTVLTVTGPCLRSGAQMTIQGNAQTFGLWD
jgi:predicted acyl esterase